MSVFSPMINHEHAIRSWLVEDDIASFMSIKPHDSLSTRFKIVVWAPISVSYNINTTLVLSCVDTWYSWITCCSSQACFVLASPFCFHLISHGNNHLGWNKNIFHLKENKYRIWIMISCFVSRSFFGKMNPIKLRIKM